MSVYPLTFRPRLACSPYAAIKQVSPVTHVQHDPNTTFSVGQGSFVGRISVALSATGTINGKPLTKENLNSEVGYIKATGSQGITLDAMSQVPPEWHHINGTSSDPDGIHYLTTSFSLPEAQQVQNTEASFSGDSFYAIGYDNAPITDLKLSILKGMPDPTMADFATTDPSPLHLVEGKNQTVLQQRSPSTNKTNQNSVTSRSVGTIAIADIYRYCSPSNNPFGPTNNTCATETPAGVTVGGSAVTPITDTKVSDNVYKTTYQLKTPVAISPGDSVDIVMSDSLAQGNVNQEEVDTLGVSIYEPAHAFYDLSGRPVGTASPSTPTHYDAQSPICEFFTGNGLHRETSDANCSYGCAGVQNCYCFRNATGTSPNLGAFNGDLIPQHHMVMTTTDNVKKQHSRNTFNSASLKSVTPSVASDLLEKATSTYGGYPVSDGSGGACTSSQQNCCIGPSQTTGQTFDPASQVCRIDPTTENAYVTDAKYYFPELVRGSYHGNVPCVGISTSQTSSSDFPTCSANPYRCNADSLTLTQCAEDALAQIARANGSESFPTCPPGTYPALWSKPIPTSGYSSSCGSTGCKGTMYVACLSEGCQVNTDCNSGSCVGGLCVCNDDSQCGTGGACVGNTCSDVCPKYMMPWIDGSCARIPPLDDGTARNFWWEGGFYNAATACAKGQDPSTALPGYNLADRGYELVCNSNQWYHEHEWYCTEDAWKGTIGFKDLAPAETIGRGDWYIPYDGTTSVLEPQSTLMAHYSQCTSDSCSSAPYLIPGKFNRDYLKWYGVDHHKTYFNMPSSGPGGLLQASQYENLPDSLFPGTIGSTQQCPTKLECFDFGNSCV